MLIHVGLASHASAVEYGNIGGYPAKPDPANPRSKSIFIHTLEAGKSVEDSVKVVNYTQETKTLLVYATDSIVSSGGAFGCAQLVDPKPNVGSWIQLETNEVTLPAQTDQIIPFTITVPDQVDVGEHDGCIVIQEKDGPTQQVEQPGGNIQLSFRTAIRVAVLVPGDIVKHLTIIDYSVSRDKKGDFILKPKVKNDGNVSLDTKVRTTTNYIWGALLNSQEQQFPILRGATSDWNFELKRPFWGGWLKSRFSVSYDGNTQNSIGDQANAETVTLTSKQIVFFSPPKPLALLLEIIILLIIIGLILWLRHRLRQRRWIAQHWQDHTVKSRQDITKLAERYGVDWKLLAKTNRLKPPYTLQRGDKIKVPPKPKTKSQKAK